MFQTFFFKFKFCSLKYTSDCSYERDGRPLDEIFCRLINLQWNWNQLTTRNTIPAYWSRHSKMETLVTRCLAVQFNQVFSVSHLQSFHKSSILKISDERNNFILFLHEAVYLPVCLIRMLPHCITKTRLFKYIENFTSNNWKFSDKKNADIFHISAQNIDCGTR